MNVFQINFIKMRFSITVIVLLVFRGYIYPQDVRLTQFNPGQPWRDSKGEIINAHGGGFLFNDGKYYWFGEHKGEGATGNQAMVGVHCYSSSDLYNWKDEGIALSVVKDNTSPIVEGCIIERPKVIFNARTKKFVMWFHLELKDKGYKAAQTGVAVSEKVTGPYTFIRSTRANQKSWPINMTPDQRNNSSSLNDFKNGSEDKKKAIKDGLFVRRDFEQGQMARDMTLFVDDDGRAYHIHASEENQTIHISELSDDYTSFNDQYVRVLPGGHNEAPAVLKYRKKYYLFTSGCTGWDPNDARVAVAESILGPWRELGNPCIGTDAELTFHSQSTAIIPVQGKTDAFVFVADRWTPKNAIDGTYVFLPILFDSNQKPVVRWMDEWNLSVFDSGKSSK